MRLPKHNLLLTAAFLGILVTASTAQEHLTGLSAHLSATNSRVAALRDVQFSVIVTNHGPTSATLNIWVLTNTMTVSVFDAQGRIIAPAAAAPPSVHLGSRLSLERSVKVGESLAFTTRFVPYRDATPPGKYRARMREIPSNEVLITIE